jgi:2'-5' RNA ligase
VTLAFLGDTEDQLIKKIGKMLYDKCTLLAPFDLIVKGIGLFRSVAEPKVLWAGLDNLAELKKLQVVIINGLKETGVSTEERKFAPHITLGRIKYLKKKESVIDLIRNYSGYVFQKVHINEIILYESILTQTGPIYKPLVSVSFTGDKS